MIAILIPTQEYVVVSQTILEAELGCLKKELRELKEQQVYQRTRYSVAAMDSDSQLKTSSKLLSITFLDLETILTIIMGGGLIL